MTTNKAAAVVSEEQVERMAKWLCRHDIAVSKDLDEVMRQMEKWPRYKDEAREALNYTLQAALGVGGWRPIDSSSRSDDLYYYPPFQGLPAVIQVGRTGLCRPATHSMPLPPPPSSEEESA